MTAAPQHVRIAIVGSGFAGLGAAIRLRQEGIEDFVVLERGADVGGVWRDNSYPGCACDVQSHLYSFSFAPNPGWTRSYSPQREILAYLRSCAARFGVLPHVRFGHEVRAAVWDAELQRWRLDTSAGHLAADVLVAATGALSEPAIPRIEGLDRFEGRVFHSARWDHSFDLAGKRVAVVGTGASAIQFIPAIQPSVGALHVFQRTPPWILPRRDAPISERSRRVYEAFPPAQRLARAWIYGLRELLLLSFREGRLMDLGERMARRYLESVVADPALRARLTPSYRIGCKRILISDDYLPALTQPNVEVVTDGIREVRARSIVTSDGAEREVDAIVLGTGFRVTDQPIARLVRGRGGRTLDEVWQGSPKAHLGTTIAGFPNLFLMQGPNTGLGHTSVIVMIEAQIEHLLEALRHLERRRAASIEPRAESQAAFVTEVDTKLRDWVWSSGGCASWYLDATGRNSTLWPGFTFAFRRRLARFVAADYVVSGGPRRVSPSSSARSSPPGPSASPPASCP